MCGIALSRLAADETHPTAGSDLYERLLGAWSIESEWYEGDKKRTGRGEWYFERILGGGAYKMSCLRQEASQVRMAHRYEPMTLSPMIGILSGCNLSRENSLHSSDAATGVMASFRPEGAYVLT
jgi:hypothetical protein